MYETLAESDILELIDLGEFIFFKWENADGWPVVFVSGNTTAILGYSPEEFQSGAISYSDIIHPDDLERVTDEVTDFSQKMLSDFVHEPYRVIKKNGDVIWVYDATHILRNKRGKITHYAGYIHDITSLKQKEMRLHERTKNLEYEISQKIKTIQEQKRMFKTLVEKSSDGIVLIKNDKFISANKAAVQILGFRDKEELFNTSFYAIISDSSGNRRRVREKARAFINKAFEEGYHRLEWCHEKRDGSFVWLDIVLTKIVLSSEEMLYATLHPIDDLKKMQYQLHDLNRRLQEDVRTQKSLYEELFNSSKDGIVLFDDETIFEYNRAILEMMRLSDLQDLQKLFAPFFAPGHPFGLKTKFLHAKEQGVYRFEWLIECTDNTRLWAEVTLTSMTITHKEIIHSHWRDITRRKELERINEEKTKQLIEQSRFAQMGEMISMIAHQWRQPLSVIAASITAMHTRLLRGKMHCDSAQEVAQTTAYFFKNFTKINSNIQYMSQTINDFRDFFKPNKHATKFSLKDAIERVYSMIGQSFVSKGISVDFYLEDTPQIYCYENEVMHVLLNLLKNAEDVLIDHAVEDPRIIITLSYEEGFHVITITDNAGGIPPQQMQKIFDPYFSTKSKNGTGLGLYMSKTIIEEHCHGRLSVINTDDGASFMIMLPPSIHQSSV